MAIVELTLIDTTSAEVLARLPEAAVVTDWANGARGAVRVAFTDTTRDEAVRGATEAGFTVAPGDA